MLKILQARPQQYVKQEIPNVQDGFRKGRGTRDQIANFRWITEKARAFQKSIYFCFIDYYMKAFDCGSQLWKILVSLWRKFSLAKILCRFGQRSNCQLPLDNRKSKSIPEKHLLLLH